MQNLNLVHLNGLRALESVGRLGSLSAAADELGVTMGAVSQQINKAELQLGQPIFERRAKGLVATPRGAEILKRLSDGFLKLSEAVQLSRRQDRDSLTISVAPVFAARWLVYNLESFSRKFPDLHLRIDATTRLIDPTISDVDICIRVGRGDWPGLRSELVLEQVIFPVCSPSLAQRMTKPSDILSMPTVVDGHAMFSWDLWLDAAGLPRQPMPVRHVFNEASLCLDAAIAGQGVMLAWQTLAAYALTAGQLVAPFGITARTGFGHYFVTASGTREPPKVRAFKAWLREELEATIAALPPLDGSGRQEPAL